MWIFGHTAASVDDSHGFDDDVFLLGQRVTPTFPPPPPLLLLVTNDFYGAIVIMHKASIDGRSRDQNPDENQSRDQLWSGNERMTLCCLPADGIMWEQETY